MIKLRCRNCHKKTGVPEKYAGRAIKCPGCETRLDVPHSTESDAIPEGTVDLAGLAAMEAAAPPSERRTAATDAPRCPSCAALLSADAVLCVACGHSLKGSGRKLETRVSSVESDVTKNRSDHSLARSAVGLIVASIVAGVFCLLWLVVTVFTGKEFGLLAWGLGALIGLVAGVIGRNPSPVYCGLAATLAGGTIIGAKAAIAAVVFFAALGVNMFADLANYNPEEQKKHYAVMDQMLADASFTGNQEAASRTMVKNYFAPASGYGLNDESTDLDWETLRENQEKVNEAVTEHLATLTPSDLEQILDQTRDRHPEWIEDPMLYLAVVDEMRTGGALEGPLAEYARHAVVLTPTDNTGNQAYFREISEAERLRRESELRALAAAHIRGLSDAERKDALRAAAIRNPAWISDNDGYHAVLSAMVIEKAFDGDQAEAAEAFVSQTMDMEWQQPFFDGMKYEKQIELSNQIAAKVNPRLMAMSAAERDQAIATAKTDHPAWNNPFGIGGDADGLRAALDEFGNTDSYASTFRGTLGGFDILWLLLAVSSAFSLARKQAG